jgi:hypothetical protein
MLYTSRPAYSTICNVNTRLPCIRGACLRHSRGQAMIEYLIVAAMLLAVVAIFALLLYALRQQSGRALELVASEYP